MSIITKKIVCEPAAEEALINHYAKFGYSLSHRDEVYNVSTSISSSFAYSYFYDEGYTKISSSEEVVNYVNLLFTREVGIPHEAEVDGLFQDCEDLYAEITEETKRQNTIAKAAQNNAWKSQSRPTIIWLVIALVFGPILGIGGCAAAVAADNPGLIALVVIGGLLFIAGLISLIPIAFHTSSKPSPVSIGNAVLRNPDFVARLNQAKQLILEKEEAASKLLAAPQEKPEVVLLPEHPKKSKKTSKATEEDVIAKKLKHLETLKAQGLLSEEEYQKKREEILASL